MDGGLGGTGPLASSEPPAQAIELFVVPKSMPIATLLTVEVDEYVRGLFNSQGETPVSCILKCGCEKQSNNDD
jgi:hypothetical protein